MAVLADRTWLAIRDNAVRWQTVGAAASLTAVDYREVFGWPAEEREGRPRLAFSSGMVGLAVPSTPGKIALESMHRWDMCGPVLELGAMTPTWVFFAEADAVVLGAAALPTETRLLCCSAVVPLPTSAEDSVRWIVPPAAGRRWLPTASAVVWAIGQAQADPFAAVMPRPAVPGLKPKSNVDREGEGQ